MNKSQKNILAIFIPIIILFIAFCSSSFLLDKNGCPYPKDKMSDSGLTYCQLHKFTNPEGYRDVSAFDFEETWWIWLIGISVIGIFEYKLFGSKKK